MISRYPCERCCAACKEVVRVGEDAMGLREPHRAWLDGSLDGKHSRYIEECPRCGHLAPDLSAEYPGLAHGRDAREELLSQEAHAPAARRCLAVAALFPDRPRDEGFWVVRAAWANEDAERLEAARPLRRRAASALEQALYEGRALSSDRLGSALLIAECFRIGGDFGRALEHCARVIENLRGLDGEAIAVLVYELDCIVAERTSPAMRRDAVAAARALSADRRRELAAVAKRVREKLPPIALRPFSTLTSGEHMLAGEEARTFARGYLDDDLLIALLANGRVGLWDAVSTHPRFFPSLVAATDHANPVVRRNALRELHDKSFGFDADILRGRDHVVSALARRLGDDDPELVRWAGAIAKQVLRLDPSFGRILVDAARAALPRWKADLSTEGVLERLIGGA